MAVPASAALIAISGTDGIGGEDMRDHAPGFKTGECSWGADTKRLNATRPETRGRRDWVF